MRDLLIITITTLLIVAVWITTGTSQVSNQQIITKELLEISTPFNGKIDSAYLNGLKKPAYDN